jgi:hypothetical protein
MEFKIKRQQEIKMAKNSEKKLRQKEKKQSSKVDAPIAVKEAELNISVQSEEEMAQRGIVAATARDEIKDNENNSEPVYV